jgi:hypothetical protein
LVAPDEHVEMKRRAIVRLSSRSVRYLAANEAGSHLCETHPNRTWQAFGGQLNWKKELDALVRETAALVERTASANHQAHVERTTATLVPPQAAPKEAPS